MLEFFDPLMKGMTAASGLGLIGLMLIRTTPRGDWKIVGLEAGPVFDPKEARTAKYVTCAFVFCVVAVMLRTLGAVI